MMLLWKVEKYQAVLPKHSESLQIQIAILKALTDNFKSVK